MALLVSSAALAASLLVGAAIGTAEAPSLSWQATATAAQPVKGLPLRESVDAQALPVSLSSMVPAYPPAASAAASPPLLSPASPQLAEQPVAFEDNALLSTHSLRTTVQRSWHTFKLAFR